MNKEISVISVSYNNKKHLLLNYELANHLNADSHSINWIIIENTPSDSELLVDKDFKDNNVNVIIGDGQGKTPLWHHSLALKQAIEKVKTRFVLVIDPDFYIVMNEWGNKVINHMMNNKLSIIGVPWHPIHSDKYRYFPAVHCCFFDTERFPIQDIDFTPDYPDGDNDPLWEDGYVEENKFFYKNPITKFLVSLPFIKHRRRFYTDTGSKFYKKYCKNSFLRYELFKPVFRHEDFPDTRSWKGKILEFFLPDELCYFPKLNNSYSMNGFRESGLLTEAPHYWEEFMWNNKPFGFHVRRHKDKSLRSEIDELECLRINIKKFMNNT